jgi:lipoprotein-anchoring transpeptidase ErfK/SrfK
LFYLQELIRSPNPRGAYGPYVFGLSAHSDVFESFGGGDGLVGLHGTNEPGSIGHSASHGCIRLSNANITTLVNLVSVGSPIVIV